MRTLKDRDLIMLLYIDHHGIYHHGSNGDWVDYGKLFGNPSELNRIKGTIIYIYIYDHSNNKPPCELTISRKKRISRYGAPFWKGKCLGYNVR